VRTAGPGGYWVRGERSQPGMHRVHAWISRDSCRAVGRSYAVVTCAVGHSLALGLYAADGARLASPGWARFAWLRGVFVETAHRGRGPGTFLAGAATSHPGVAGIGQVLIAKPERSICRGLGFGVLVSAEILTIFGRPGGQMRVRGRAGRHAGGTLCARG
jgi:hypothetical protein